MTKTMTARAATPDLEDVRVKIEHWRRTRPSSRSRMPDGLWRAAVALCEERTVHAVSQQLGLGYDRLRRKVVEAELLEARASAEPEAPEFVELRLAEPLEGMAARSTVERDARARGGPARWRRPSAPHLRGRRPIRAHRSLPGDRPMIQVTPQMRILVAVQPADLPNLNS